MLRFQMWGAIDESQAFKTKADVNSKTTAPSDPTRPMRAVIAKKEVVAVLRSISVHLAIGLGAFSAPRPAFFVQLLLRSRSHPDALIDG